MLSEFMLSVANLTNQSILFVGFLGLIFVGVAIAAHKLMEDKNLYWQTAVFWMGLTIFAVMMKNAVSGVIFTNPIIVAVCGAIAGLGLRIYQALRHS